MFDDHLFNLNNFAELDHRTKDQPCQNTVQSVLDRELTQPCKKAHNIIHDVELAKAKILQLPGKDSDFKHTKHLLCDESYFHYAAHVDRSIRNKIKKGQYVDLEKLLLKNRRLSRNENRMEFIIKNRTPSCRRSNNTKPTRELSGVN